MGRVVIGFCKVGGETLWHFPGTLAVQESAGSYEGTLLTLAEHGNIALGMAEIDLAWTGDLLLAVCKHFRPL
jgi:hypothetical protein